jgi:hypothetical protein
MLTAFGSPLFYYVIFEPAYKHAVDTLFLTLAVLLLLRASRRVDMRDAVWLGAVAGVSFNIRWANAPFFFVFLVAAFLAGRKRQALVGLGFAVLVGAAITVLPALRGIDYFVPSYFPKSHGAVHDALGAHGIIGAAGTSNPLNGFDPLIPLKMLFSFHRGLFIWTPLTFAMTIGFGLAVYRLRKTSFFGPLATLAVAALALLLAHIVWGDWDGGFSFSSRFLTGLFPLFLIGMAELVRRQAAVAYAIAVAGAAFAVTIGFVHELGYDGISASDGINAHLRALDDNRGNYRHKIRVAADNRWDYLWAVLRGGDSRTP